MHIFPYLTKILQSSTKKNLEIFCLRRVPTHYIKFYLGQKYKSRRGGGKNMNFKYNLNPCFILNHNPSHFVKFESNGRPDVSSVRGDV